MGLQCLLGERLDLKVLPLDVECACLFSHVFRRDERDSILRGQECQALQRLETPFRFNGLVVLRSLDPRPQVEPLRCASNRSVPVISLKRQSDGLVQVVCPPGVVAAELACCGGRGLATRGRRSSRLAWCRRCGRNREKAKQQIPKHRVHRITLHDRKVLGPHVVQSGSPTRINPAQ